MQFEAAADRTQAFPEIRIRVILVVTECLGEFRMDLIARFCMTQKTQILQVNNQGAGSTIVKIDAVVFEIAIVVNLRQFVFAERLPDQRGYFEDALLDQRQRTVKLVQLFRGTSSKFDLA